MNLVCKVARAVGCPTVGVDLVGRMTHGSWAGRAFGGRSVAADASGEVLALARDREVDVFVVDLGGSGDDFLGG